MSVSARTGNGFTIELILREDNALFSIKDPESTQWQLIGVSHGGLEALREFFREAEITFAGHPEAETFIGQEKRLRAKFDPTVAEHVESMLDRVNSSTTTKDRQQ